MCRVSTAIPSHQNHTELLHRDRLLGLDRQGYWETLPSLLELHQQGDERWERGFQSALKKHHEERDHQDEPEILEDSLLGLEVG